MAQQFLSDDNYQDDGLSPGSVTPNRGGIDQDERSPLAANGFNHIQYDGSSKEMLSGISEEGAAQHPHFSTSPAATTPSPPMGVNKKIAVLTSGGDSAGMNAAGK